MARALPLPPVVSGALPVLGHAVEFLRNPESLMERGYTEHGCIFSVRLPGRPGIAVLGPEHSRFLFAETDKRLSIRTAYPFFRHMFAPDNYFLAEWAEYQRQRDILLPRFQGRQLDGYVLLMRARADALVDGLDAEGQFDLPDTLGPMVLGITADCFLGPGVGDRMPRGLSDTFRRFAEGQDPLLPGWMPLPHLRRSRRARDELRAAVTGLLADRRANPVEPPDFLQTITEARYADGATVPDRIRMNLVLTLIHAGHETTTGHLCWALVDLLRNPDELHGVLAEQDELLPPGQPLTVKSMHRLARLDRALHESERLHPITPGVVRRAVEPIEHAGYRIPRGAIVLADPRLSHRLPDVFPDPERYRPDRFLDDQQAKQALIGFGGGVHRCLGARFAYLEIQVVLATLFQRLDLRLIDFDPQTEPGQRLKWPRRPCRVWYRRKS